MLFRSSGLKRPLPCDSPASSSGFTVAGAGSATRRRSPSESSSGAPSGRSPPCSAPRWTGCPFDHAFEAPSRQSARDRQSCPRPSRHLPRSRSRQSARRRERSTRVLSLPFISDGRRAIASRVEQKRAPPTGVRTQTTVREPPGRQATRRHQRRARRLVVAATALAVAPRLPRLFLEQPSPAQSPP